MSIDAAAYMAVMYYSMACYPVFARIGTEAAKEAADFCSERAMEWPLFERNKKGEFPQYDVPHFGKKSSVYCAAIMSAFLVWTQKAAGNPLPDTDLLKAGEEGYMLWTAFKPNQEEDRR